MKVYKLTQFLLLFLLILTAFVEAHPSHEPGHEALEKKLRLGVLPDAAHESLQKRVQPLIQYLTEETGIKFQYIRVNNYEELLESFYEREIDFAWFGGYTFVKAQLQDRAIPLIMRDVDFKFSSYFLVRKNHPANSIFDFKNKVIAFGSRLSTSGHLMPRYFLSNNNIIPENYFSEVRYSGKHDTTLKWVRDGTVDLGVTNSKIIDRMLREDGSLQKEIRVIWETPPYSNYVWAIHPSISEHTQIAVRDAFLSLSGENPEHKKILDQWNARKFYPASIEDFLIIRKIVKKLKQE